MELDCDMRVGSRYKSASQRARVISEEWFERNSYCLSCDAESLRRSVPNTRATDFLCTDCGRGYELKTFRRRPPKSLVDGAYASLLSRIDAGTTPTLCLLERNDDWQIRSLTAIHPRLLTRWAVAARPPLGPSARRAGWVGCNIRLDRIPPDGEIHVIQDGCVRPYEEARQKFRRFLPLSTASAEQRGWTALTLSLVRGLARKDFSLNDLYRQEAQFAQVYPNNRHVRDKIRQQLQILRDLGVVHFKGNGQYSMLD
jgi:type II restriction enzyme